MFEQFTWNIPDYFITAYWKKFHQLPIKMSIVYFYNKGNVRLITSTMISEKMQFLIITDSFNKAMKEAAEKDWQSKHNAKPIADIEVSEGVSCVELAETFYEDHLLQVMGKLS